MGAGARCSAVSVHVLGVLVLAMFVGAVLMVALGDHDRLVPEVDVLRIAAIDLDPDNSCLRNGQCWPGRELVRTGQELRLDHPPTLDGKLLAGDLRVSTEVHATAAPGGRHPMVDPLEDPNAHPSQLLAIGHVTHGAHAELPLGMLFEVLLSRVENVERIVEPITGHGRLIVSDALPADNLRSSPGSRHVSLPLIQLKRLGEGGPGIVQTPDPPEYDREVDQRIAAVV
jgi:hypothetical protein